MWWTHLFTTPSPRSRFLALVARRHSPSQLSIVPAPLRAQTGQVIDVPSGGNLQQALNAVQPGGTVRFAAGATFVGSFTLRAKAACARRRAPTS